MHNETTDYITLPGRQRLIRIEDEPKGLLGVYTSKTRAKTQGRRWLYLQLSGLADQPYLPLPYSRDNEDDRPLPGTWSRTGWINDKYTILDKGRYHDEYVNDFEDVSLSVTIEERYVDALDEGQGYETEMEQEEEDYVPRTGRGAASIIGVQARAA